MRLLSGLRHLSRLPVNRHNLPTAAAHREMGCGFDLSINDRLKRREQRRASDGLGAHETQTFALRSFRRDNRHASCNGPAYD
jgi:hypothetical protein